MKNKSKTTLLTLAVLVIWSLVIYRFVDLSGSNNPQYNSPKKTSTPSIVNKAKKEFEYHLNYSEPFAINQVYKIDDSKKNIKQTKKIKPLPKKIIWPKVKYIGQMSSSNASIQPSYFIEIDQKMVTIIDQDSIGPLKIIQLHKDSVYFENEKERKAFYIE